MKTASSRTLAQFTPAIERGVEIAHEIEKHAEIIRQLVEELHYDTARVHVHLDIGFVYVRLN